MATIESKWEDPGYQSIKIYVPLGNILIRQLTI